MFKRNSKGREVTFSLDGEAKSCQSGETVAAAILALNIDYSRKTPISGTPRAPFCMMGVCFECIMEINGIPNQQACLTVVEDGMQVKRQDFVLGSDWA